MVTIRQERAGDVVARDALLDAAFGAARHAKTAERLRDQRQPADGLSFVATESGAVIGTVRLWPVATDAGAPALLLGPLAVAREQRNRGVGAALMRHALRAARRRGYGAVLLVGDASYYGRFGFSADKTHALRLPGPYERERLLGHELTAGALTRVRGLVRAAGRLQQDAAPAAAQRRAA